MPDYKEMYLVLFRAAEQAINGLIDAQRKCEEMYLEDSREDVDILAKEPEES